MGQVRVGGKQHQRVLGDVRRPGTKDGLTRALAERALRDVRATLEDENAQRDGSQGPPGDATLSEVAIRHLEHLTEVVGRKRSTTQDYSIYLRKHLLPFFSEDRALRDISPQDVEAFMRHQRDRGLATSTITNHVNYLNSIFAYAVKRSLVATNPVAYADKPRAPRADPDIKFLTVEELEAVLRAVADDHLGDTDHALVVTAAMTGLRQGELVALRWKDVDWTAGVVRVRRNYTRGEEGTPKSRRSSRAVPMADRVAAALEQHFQRSAYTRDDDRVFCHPQSGNPYDAAKIRERFYDALDTAKLSHLREREDPITFHSLRHTFGTQMAAAGAPIRAIQEWMGHADIQTTMIYADYAPDPSNGRAWAQRAFSADASIPVAV